MAVPLAVASFGCGEDDPSAGSDAGTVPTVSDTGEPPGSSSTPPTTEPSTPSTATTPASFSVEPLPPSSSASGSLPGSPIDPTLPLVTAAVEDLAGRLGIEPDAVTVVAAQAVTWSDGSLGCPEPGMMYTQVLVDGTLVVLEAGGRRYEYHGGDPLSLCENPKPPTGGSGTG
jgi:hypothetical protein